MKSSRMSVWRATIVAENSVSTEAIQFSKARCGLGQWLRSVWLQGASRWPLFGDKPPAKDRISQWTYARRCGVSADFLMANGKPSMADRPRQVAMRLAHS